MSDNPQVIRIGYADAEELAELFQTAADSGGFVRVMVQDNGLKAAYEYGTWSRPLGEDITPTPQPATSNGCPCTWRTNKPSQALHTMNLGEF